MKKTLSKLFAISLVVISMSVNKSLGQVASITITSPNGGEVWMPLSQQTVTWTWTGTVGNVNIDLSPDGGSNWINLVSNTQNDGQEDITVPNNPSTVCRIRIQDISGTPADVSNYNFTIEDLSPILQVSSTTLDFGNVERGSIKSLPLTIINIGSGTLNGTITSDTNWLTAVPTTFEGNIIHATVTVSNAVLNQNEGSYSGRLNIATNGGNATVTAELNAIPPVNPILTVDKEELDFGEIKIGEKKSLTLQIVNSGGGTLDGIITSNAKWLFAEPTSFTADIGITIIVTVNFTEELSTTYGYDLELVVGEYIAELVIGSNGGNKVISVKVKATCVLPKPNPYNPTKEQLTFFGSGIVPKDTAIEIYSLSGKLIKTLKETEGKDEITWDGTNEEGNPVTNGIYIYTYESPKEKGLGKLTVLRNKQ